MQNKKYAHQPDRYQSQNYKLKHIRFSSKIMMVKRFNIMLGLRKIISTKPSYFSLVIWIDLECKQKIEMPASEEIQVSDLFFSLAA
jgi:hypothetical protein